MVWFCFVFASGLSLLGKRGVKTERRLGLLNKAIQRDSQSLQAAENTQHPDLPRRHPAGRGGGQGAGLGPSGARVLLCWFVLELMSLIISLYVLHPMFFMPCFSTSVTGGANYLCDINS